MSTHAAPPSMPVTSPTYPARRCGSRIDDRLRTVILVTPSRDALLRREWVPPPGIARRHRARHGAGAQLLSRWEWGEMLVTIIGAGLMGRGIGIRMVSGGNDVEIHDKDDEKARALAQDLVALGGGRAAGAEAGYLRGEVVVLALPYAALAGVVGDYREQLAGKVVIEISNPVDFSTMEGVVTPPGSSAAEEVAKLLPDGAQLVKAFNTTFGNTLVSGAVAGQHLDVLLAGDDLAAKEMIADLVRAGGLRPIDVGPLRRARQLEQLGFLHISLQGPLDTEFTSAVKFLW